MKPFKRTALVAAFLPLVMPSAWGLGLGDVTMRSFLNEPLRAEVKLLDVKDLTTEDIRIRLATQEDFDRLGVERAYFLTSIQFEIVVDGEDSKIIMTTEQPLLEPYLDFLIETRWPAGRLLREYTVLVDLPRKAETVRVASSAKGPAVAGSDTASEAIREQSAEPAGEPTFVTPETRPDRAYDRDAEDRPAAGGQYLVQANDTLWDIARSARPDGATIEQTMIATVAMNANAFTGSNINGLKAGYVLELPAPGEIYTSQNEAIAEVAQQNSDWASGIRRAPALRVLADNEMDSSEDEFDSPETDMEAATSDSELGESDVIAAAAAGMDDSAAMAEEAGTTQSMGMSEEADKPPAMSANPELADIQARLGQLSDQVGSLRQLVTVKDQQIAALQAEIAARDQQDAERAAAPPAVATNPTPPQTTSDIAGMPWWVFALGGVILASLVGVLVARRSASHKAPAPVPASQLSATQRDPVSSGSTTAPVKVAAKPAPVAAAMPSDEAAAQDQESEDSAIPSGERGYGQKLHNDYAEESAVSDAIAEAAIYVAYGRHQQALDLLATASAADPTNSAAYLKMIEIYLANDRHEEAEDLLPAIEATNDASAIKQAKEMLENAAPASTQDVDLGELSDGAPGAGSEPALTATETPASELAPMEFELETPIASEPTGTEEPAAALDLELDFEPVESAPAPKEDELTLSVDEDLAQAPAPAPDWGDLSETIDRGDRLPPELAAVLGSDVPPPAEMTSDDDDNELIYATEADPIDTKLDLARAYLDMGDEEGARPVLEEVVAKGDLQQQAEARELLIRID